MTRCSIFIGLALIMAATTLAANPPALRLKDTLPAQLPLDKIPLGLDARPVPKDAALSDARVRLGRRLFFDPILSVDRSVACATCHQPDHGFASADARPLGVHGQRLTRRAPTLWNRAYGSAFFWDGRAATLEDQALQPISNPTEMGATVASIVERLRAEKQYRSEFQAAFPDGVTAPNLARALAAFERVLLRGDSAVDRFRRQADHNALTPQQRHGLWLFESKGGCWRCHSGANFTDESFHNTGVSWGKEPLDLGRYVVTHHEADRGKFKTPTLRGVILRPPYMHDGSLSTLKDVVQFYSRGGGANPHLDPALGPINLSPDEVDDLVALLKAL